MLKHTIIAVFFASIMLLLTFLSLFIVVELKYFIYVGLLWFLIVLIGSTLIFTNYHIKAFCSNSLEKQNVISLTFDDGPHEMTELVLEVLKKHQVKATFFCIGKNIEKYPGILKKINEEGHLIGNHSYSHASFFDFYRKNRVLEEIQKTDALINSIIEKKANFFRPPYGVTNPSIRRALSITKHKTIGWSIRSLDGIVKNKKFIYYRIISRIAPGKIVLLHDTTIQSVEVLERLLIFLELNKYKVVSLEQLLNIKAYED
jgi:peptidoglycan/xylan/chitin deacetylase (PgdA/CDA1 family)